MSAILAATGTFEVPTIEYAALAPILIVLGGAVVSVLLEAFLPQRHRRPIQLMLTFATLIAAFVFVVLERGTRAIVAEGSVAVDGPTLFMQGSILVLAFIAALVMAERQQGRPAAAAAACATGQVWLAGLAGYDAALAARLLEPLRAAGFDVPDPGSRAPGR